ncbi:hypothetical protein EC957_006299 [Mortierella hygrophila]|uniref:RRM domain-containing protein n=1 Tax=Mortierella hygrophila TaxID=979708 RepID=A0A9P6K6F2_9FUNG|nr:hypothetical protein EC957_006299 [Mortierella hygrophila]
MVLMDQSLDDIIKLNKLEAKKVTQKPTLKAPLKAPKRTALSMPKSPYGRPVHKEAPLFTETYKAWNAPVAAIFTSSYVPKTEPIKLVVYNERISKPTRNDVGASTSSTYEPGTKSGIRLSTSHRTWTDTYRPAASTARGKSSQGDFYRPEPSGSRRHESRQRRDSKDAARLPSSSASHGNWDDRRKSSSAWESAPVSGMGIDDVRKYINKKSQSNGGSSNKNHNNNHNGKGKDIHGNNHRGSRSVDNSAPLSSKSEDGDMDIVEIKQEEEEQFISIKGAAPVEVDVVNGPVTIEIENLDRGTTAEDVKVVCSRFGEIKSCVCSNGFSQVTYARKAAGVAAVETLNGKKADNNQILRVTMLKAPIFHNVAAVPSPHVPSSIAGPMKLLTRAVQGTITNAGSIYSNQLMMAQQVLKMQQHRVAQLHLEEQEMTLRRIQGVTGPIPGLSLSALPVSVPSPTLQDLTQSPAREDHNNSGLL